MEALSISTEFDPAKEIKQIGSFTLMSKPNQTFMKLIICFKWVQDQVLGENEKAPVTSVFMFCIPSGLLLRSKSSLKSRKANRLQMNEQKSFWAITDLKHHFSLNLLASWLAQTNNCIKLNPPSEFLKIHNKNESVIGSQWELGTFCAFENLPQSLFIYALLFSARFLWGFIKK